VRKLGAEPVIPYPSNVKDPLIDLWLTKRFKVKGDPRLVSLYRLRMSVERSFRAGKLELMMENLRWRGVAKVRMHVAILLRVHVCRGNLGSQDRQTEACKQHSSLHLLNA